MDRLTEMEAFATVVDQGGFTDAAKKMGISKSAVSKHVSSLEARLGARLLNRTTRRVSPTEIGLAYYDRARRVLNDAGEADALVTSMQSAPSGLLRISVATDFGVNYSAVDAAKLGFKVTVIESLCRAIDFDGSLDAARAGMTEAGVTLA